MRPIALSDFAKTRSTTSLTMSIVPRRRSLVVKGAVDLGFGLWVSGSRPFKLDDVWRRHLCVILSERISRKPKAA